MDATHRLSYVVNRNADLSGPREYLLDPATLERAVHRTRVLVRKISALEVDVFALLGMRNLSSFVGEVFAASMILEEPGSFRKNPHQDGYPDLLLMDSSGESLWKRLEAQLREKAPFSPFATGGFEVKATCGSVPTPDACRRKGVEKPDLGDQRIALMTGYDWKAHHRETNYLFGVVWDFLDRCPTIVAVFYGNNLNERDWGEIVKPREGGGRTTSVSIMTRDGIRKMYNNWILVAEELEYATFFDGRNGGSLLADGLREWKKRRQR